VRKYAAIQVMSQAGVSAAGFFIPVLIHELGGSALDVGLVAAGYGLAQFLASYHFGRVADVGNGGRRRLLKWGLGLTAVAALLQALATSDVLLGAGRILFGVCAGMYPAALTSLAYDENRKLGRFSSWGSLGMGLGVLTAGSIAVSGLVGNYATPIFLFSAALLGVCFLIALTIKYPPDHTIMVPTFPKEVIDRNLPAYMAMVFRHTGVVAVWCLLPLYVVHTLGGNLLWLGLITATNAAGQFVFMPLTDRWSSRTLILAGVGLSAASIAALLLVPSLWWVLALQPVFAASWAASYMGSLKFVLERNVERATSTGLLQSTIHLSNVSGPILGGAIAHLLGFPVTVIAAVVVTVAAVPVFLWELKRHPSKILTPEAGAPAPVAAPVPAPAPMPVAPPAAAPAPAALPLAAPTAALPAEPAPGTPPR